MAQENGGCDQLGTMQDQSLQGRERETEMMEGCQKEEKQSVREERESGEEESEVPSDTEFRRDGGMREEVEEEVTVEHGVNERQKQPAGTSPDQEPEDGSLRIPQSMVDGDLVSKLSEAHPSCEFTQSAAELRLILLGRAGSGKSTAGNSILGCQAFEPGSCTETALRSECDKRRATVAGRQVAVVDTPDLFCSGCPLEEVRRQLSLCAALAAPGPHAFLLCAPVDRSSETELRALEALEEVFGPEAVSGHTLVLFTRVDQLSEGLTLEEHITTRRRDLLELLERCGGRHHALERGSGGGEEEKERERRSVEELLEKVEQTVIESGMDFYTCPLFQEAEARVRQRQEEIVRPRRGRGGGGGGGEEESLASSSHSEQEVEVEVEEMERAREEAERSVDDLEVDGVSSLSSPSPPPSFLRSVWETVTGWVRRLPGLVRIGALLGALVRLFVGGPVGGMLGSAVGSVATEVGRRKKLKTK